MDKFKKGLENTSSSNLKPNDDGTANSEGTDSDAGAESEDGASDENEEEETYL